MTDALLPIAKTLREQEAINCRCFFPEPRVVYWILYSPLNAKQILESGICRFDSQMRISNQITHFDSVPFSLQGREYAIALDELYPVQLLFFLNYRSISK